VRAPGSPGLDDSMAAAMAAAEDARVKRTTALQSNVSGNVAPSYASHIIENYKTYWEQYSHNSQMTLDIISLLVGKFSQVSENLEELMGSREKAAREKAATETAAVAAGGLAASAESIPEYLSVTYPDTPLGILIQLLEKIQSITSTGVRGGGQCGGSSAGDGSQGVAADQPDAVLQEILNVVSEIKKDRDEEGGGRGT